MADVYTGIRAKDWLERQHIKHVRKKIREARKADAQRFLAFEPTKQPSTHTNLSAPTVRKKRGK